MSYQVDYEGQLKIINPSVKVIAKLQMLCGADLWEMGYDTDCRYLDLELAEGMEHLKHDGSEKSYEMGQQIQALLTEMRKDFPEFKLEGCLEVEDEFGGSYKVGGDGEKEF